MSKSGLVWIRRDIRLHDHPALAACLAENEITYLVFVFDPHILNPLSKKSSCDRRIQFIAESLLEIAKTLQKNNTGMVILKGVPAIEVPNLVKKLRVNTLYFNHDYSPYAIKRDQGVSEAINKLGVKVKTFKDHVIFEPHEILKKDGQPYRVFTPFSKVWLSKFVETDPTHMVDTICSENIKSDVKSKFFSVSDILQVIGFSSTGNYLKGGSYAGRVQLASFEKFIDRYDYARDFPGLDQTSHLSVYIRHGCLSIRDLVRFLLKFKSKGSDVWLNELIWREFYQMILFHFPHVVNDSFNAKYNHFVYPGSEMFLLAWKEGQTGFPIIDAAMRCLNLTGWMHNRLRMIVASFLCKILLIDWRRGERYFAWKLLDYELASNNGGWQWASGTGCDAAPYFRIFNPYTQSKKFDPEGEFIKLYCPELAQLNAKQIHCPPLVCNYPKPIVDYARKRQESLFLYSQIKNNEGLN
jgi:deoxyribodipyrimidine photo-lyase